MHLKKHELAHTGEKIEYSIHFEFQTTNNVAEYEALLSGIRLTRALGASKVHFYTDSRLVANQVRGDFVSKEDSTPSPTCRFRPGKA